MQEKEPNTFLSKSLFIRGLQCHKSLYLHKYHPELRDGISKEKEALFETGFEVGKYAQQLFPGGVEISYDETSYDSQIQKTQDEIRKGTETIYEGAFSYDDIFVKVDILHKDHEGWKIFEVKSSTELKPVYIDDAAIQYYVLNGAGLPVSKVFLAHINNQYVRDGEIDPRGLFTINDISDSVRQKQPYIADNIARQKEMLKNDMPDIDIGEHCEKPYECDFQGHCWQHIPQDSVFDLRRKGVNKYDLYRQGIIELKNIPLDTLNRYQRLQVESFLNKADKIDKDAIKTFLDSVFYPLCFLDFETFFTAIPLFDGIRPYRQVLFQYSLHIQDTKGAELKHFEYLAEPRKDPRRELLTKLIDTIPEKNCIITYSDFEAERLRELAERFPEYKDRIEDLIKNIRDISLPFDKMDYYHWQMNGSYSLKAVLPILVPEMSYQDLAIRDGGMAMDAYFAMSQLSDQKEIERMRRDILEYCKLDTLAMVRILERLREILEQGNDGN
jgi:hypothetical protein